MEQKRGKVFITSWDDDSQHNYRLAALLKKYNIPAVFYLTNAASQKMVSDLFGMGFEIGGHTTTHPEDMKRLSDEALVFEIVTNKNYLEGITKTRLRKFCYPGGKHNEKTKEAVRSLGFDTARTTNVLSIRKPADPFSTWTTIHARPNRKEYLGKNWEEIASKLFDDVFMRNMGDFYELWGHSWEIEQYGLWDALERLFKRYKNYADIYQHKT